MPIVDFDESFYKILGLPHDDDEIKFEIYRFYLENFVNLINNQYENTKGLIKFLNKNTKRYQGNKALDINYVKGFLFIAWNTEYLVSINDQTKDYELLRINNQWKPIQVYYTVYSQAEASSYAIDCKKSGGHKKCLKKINAFLVKTPFFPWNLAYEGARGKDKKQSNPVNFPTDIERPSALKRQDVSSIENIAVCLHAQHIKKIDDNFQKSKGFYKYQFNPGHTTILDFLYRLRIKSNYKEASIFLTDAPDSYIQGFSENLSSICEKTSIVFETIIIRKIGKKAFIQLIDTFLVKNKRAKNLKYRRKLYKSLIN